MADRRQREEELEQLTAYLDGELTDAERAKVERLIADDPEAARLLIELRQTSNLLRSLPRATASAGLAAHIADRLEREALLGDAEALGGETRQPPLRWMRPLSMAAGFVLVVTAGWLLWPQFSERNGAITAGSRVRNPLAAPEASETPAESMTETTLALGASKDRRLRSAPPAAKMGGPSERDVFRKDLSDNAPMALAPPAAARQETIRRDVDAEVDETAERLAGSAVAAQRALLSEEAGEKMTTPTSPPTTSSPTSAPTTTSAPATSQPTTRSIP